jgi:AcrR family transcriptional regulator
MAAKAPSTGETGTRERIVNATAELFRRQGYTGTGVKQIVAEAQAPFGSLYHFFPGGKEQLGTEVLHIAGDMYLALFAEIAAGADDVPGAIADFFSGAAETLRETDYADACPIATVALEVASTNEPLRLATADVFTRWIDAAGAFIASAGVDQARARSLALTMLCLLEGGFLFSRALRSPEPLEAAGASAVAAIGAALAEVEKARPR